LSKRVAAYVTRCRIDWSSLMRSPFSSNRIDPESSALRHMYHVSEEVRLAIGHFAY
jgi:hypothetical protein